MDTMPYSRGTTEHSCIGFEDGSIKIVSKFGKIEKNIPDAHKKSITCLKWSHDSQTIVSTGEDGVVKVNSSLATKKYFRYGQNLACSEPSS
jgi:WD40 repeat protein